MNDQQRGQSQPSSRFGAQWRTETGSGEPPRGIPAGAMNQSQFTGPLVHGQGRTAGPYQNRGSQYSGMQQPVYPNQGSQYSGVQQPVYPNNGSQYSGVQQPVYPNQGSQYSGVQQPVYPNTGAQPPVNPYPPVNRGSGRSGQLRQWQMETAVAPENPNPFEEAESAPELQGQRNTAMYDKSKEFWKNDTGTHEPAPQNRTSEIPSPGMPVRSVKKSRAHKEVGTRKWTGILSAILILAVLFVGARFLIFNINEIEVVGNKNISADVIRRISGIHINDGILTLDDKKVEAAVEGDYRLQFRYLEKKIPGKVILAVRERDVVAKINYCGIVYYLDRQRMVMAESEDTSVMTMDNFVEVKGLNIRSCRTGQTMALTSAAQESVYEEVFRELRVVDILPMIREIDLSNPESMYLVTSDDFTIALGNRKDLHAKLHAMLAVRERLLSMNYVGGTIDVTVPESPAYSMPNV